MRLPETWTLDELSEMRKTVKEYERTMLNAAKNIKSVIRQCGAKLPDEQKDELYRVVEDLENSTSRGRQHKKSMPK